MPDKLKNIRHKVLIEGVPVVKENTCCWFLCKVISGMDVGQEMGLRRRDHSGQ